MVLRKPLRPWLCYYYAFFWELCCHLELITFVHWLAHSKMDDNPQKYMKFLRCFMYHPNLFGSLCHSSYPLYLVIFNLMVITKKSSKVVSCQQNSPTIEQYSWTKGIKVLNIMLEQSSLRKMLWKIATYCGHWKWYNW